MIRAATSALLRLADWYAEQNDALYLAAVGALGLLIETCFGGRA
jgi:hypothetical protein